MFEAPIGSQAAGASFKGAWTLDDVKEEWITQIEDEHPARAYIITAQVGILHEVVARRKGAVP